MFTKVFWLNTAERAIKTFAQALLLVFVGDSAYNVISVNWPESLGLAATGALISVLTSLVSSTVGPKDSPSLVGGQIEQGVVDKIESGEPVGDPPVIVEAPTVVEVEDRDEVEATDPAEVVQPVKKAAPRKRAPRKKVAE